MPLQASASLCKVTDNHRRRNVCGRRLSQGLEHQWYGDKSPHSAADVGEHRHQQNLGDLVSPETFHTADVLSEIFEVSHPRLAQEGFHQPRHPARRDHGIE